jgi:hypothetical protein
MGAVTPGVTAWSTVAAPSCSGVNGPAVPLKARESGARPCRHQPSRGRCCAPRVEPGHRHGSGRDGLKTTATRGTLRAAPRQPLAARATARVESYNSPRPRRPIPEAARPGHCPPRRAERNPRRRRRDANQCWRGSRSRARPPLSRSLIKGTGGLPSGQRAGQAHGRRSVRARHEPVHNPTSRLRCSIDPLVTGVGAAESQASRG